MVVNLEHGLDASSFILDRMGQVAQGILETHLVSPYRMSPPSCTHRASIVPLVARGWGVQYGGHASHRVGRRPIVVKEIEKSGSEDSEDSASNMS
ncbi:hypothetical protein JCGZ_10534 [Jatropha curcas]|uniref:Uncharacterized protein n=1 Tax=Jatropha curcas TaxID=180498 RepID=A0A067KUL9_JATCU|nr:hypothetical protein JCGZ_10534 [Jatropha curcas]